MEIDIISYSPVQLACLNFSALREIRDSQIKKNKLLRLLEKRLAKEKSSLLKKGLFDSCIWTKIQEERRAECNVEIEEIRQALLFYLEYTTTKKMDIDDVPYSVDYELSFDERYVEVKRYYLTTYTDAKECFETFILDKFAPVYLGELYTTLYDEFAVRAGR